MKPLIGLTIGDPAGIGPEIVLKALSRSEFKCRCEFLVYGDIGVLEGVSQSVLRRKRLPDATYEPVTHLSGPFPRFGVPSAAYGYSSGRFIEAAIQDALSGRIQAVVTAPINKESFRLGGWGKRFIGHTEMFARLTNAKRTALMLIHGSLRAVHVTSHIALRDVPRSLTRERVLDAIELSHEGLTAMGIRNPRIAVCGLNPHAGDNGLMGREEITVIRPAVMAAIRRKIKAKGPLSADIVWPQIRDGAYDVGVAMYHDQGQIPVKFSAFSSKKNTAVVQGVNVTLGLPIIRTSVAHGTAYELAGQGSASDQSLADAIHLALVMAKVNTRK